MQECNIIFFSSNAGIQKTTCNLANLHYHLFFFTYVNKNIICRLTSVQYHFISFHVWIEKTTYKLTSVQYHFFSSPMWMRKKPLPNHLLTHKCAISFFFFNYMNFKKPLVGSQGCNIILSLQLCELKNPFVNSQVCNIVSFLLKFSFLLDWNFQSFVIFFHQIKNWVFPSLPQDIHTQT